MERSITITLTDEEGTELARFLLYKQRCGDLLPDVNPLDALGLKVLAAARAQHGAQQPPPPGAPLRRSHNPRGERG